MFLGELTAAELQRWRTRTAVGAATIAAVVAGWWGAQRSPFLVGGAIVGAMLVPLALYQADVALAGLIAIIALLPFGVVPVRLGVAPTFLDAATALVFLVWLARAAAGRGGTRLTGIGGGLVLFAGTMVATNVLASSALRLDEPTRVFFKIIMAHLLFIPVFNLADRHGTPRKLVLWLATVCTLEALIGIALFAVPHNAAFRILASLGSVGYPTDSTVLRYLPETTKLRAIGTSVDPNMLGALLMVGAALIVPQLFATRPVMRRRFALLALVPMGLCLLLTYSRGSLAGLVGALVVLAALRYRKLGLWLAALGALSLFLPQTHQFLGHFIDGLRAQDRASAMRIGEFQNAFAIIQQHPLLGVGWAQVGQSIELEFTLGVSSVFLTVAERSGLLALAVYVGTLFALAAPLWPAVRRRARALEDDGLLLGLTGALIATQVAGLVDHHFVRFPHTISLLWIVAALAVAQLRDE